MSTGEVKSCEECGASVYPEHVNANKAGMWHDKLVCVHCMAKHRNQQVTIDPQDFAQSSPGAARQVAASQPPVLLSNEPGSTDSLISDLDADLDAVVDRAVGPEDPILLEDAPSKNITTFSKSGFRSANEETQQKFKRPLQHDGAGSTRVRIFHAKLNDGAMHFMQDQINEWIDTHADVEIKHASTQVGVVEGKSQEPHLIITLFY